MDANTSKRSNVDAGETEGSVWYRLLPNQPLDACLSDHTADSESGFPE